VQLSVIKNTLAVIKSWTSEGKFYFLTLFTLCSSTLKHQDAQSLVSQIPPNILVWSCIYAPDAPTICKCESSETVSSNGAFPVCAFITNCDTKERTILFAPQWSKNWHFHLKSLYDWSLQGDIFNKEKCLKFYLQLLKGSNVNYTLEH